ncbi:hypothetical protein [Heyndrickxia acidiproducens]|uniref:hypothetical protein n=1 Tax=Heyndrickxia acidiproducens TaxID=1121084 RepID=UPI00036575F0|nr:hypothetical protein [Heyndrickxia acidiproducens]
MNRKKNVTAFTLTLIGGLLIVLHLFLEYGSTIYNIQSVQIVPYIILVVVPMLVAILGIIMSFLVYKKASNAKGIILIIICGLALLKNELIPGILFMIAGIQILLAKNHKVNGIEKNTPAE